MFKLAATTALIACAAAKPTAGDKVDSEVSGLKKSAEKYKSTPGSKVWNYNKKTKDYTFMAGTKPSTYTALAAKAKIEDLKDSCELCFMTGNDWTAADGHVAAKCAAVGKDAKGKAYVDTDEAEMDYNLTYEQWITGSQKCAQVAGCTQATADQFSTADFNLKKNIPTGKKGDKPYTWSYKYSAAVKAWDTCHHTAVMPVDPKTHKTKWAGGLFLSHVIPKDMDVQAVVQINTGVANAEYLYNSITIEKLSVGNTKKIVIPVADSIDVLWTSLVDQTDVSTFELTFTRATTAQLAEFTLEHGGVIVWVIIGIVVFCLLCVGVIVWKKCFHKNDQEFYLEDCYARV